MNTTNQNERRDRRADDQLPKPKLPLRWGERWTLLLTGPNAGVVGQYGATWPGQPADYERVNVYAEGAVKLDDIEQYRLQMAAIGTASFGYWKEGDSIHPDYDTVPLRDVARLFAKYDQLYKFREQVRVMVAMLKNREWAEDLAATGDAAELQAVITELVGKLAAASNWISTGPHGDNCFVSDHHEGDPGNRCNCGKDALQEFLESDKTALDAVDALTAEEQAFVELVRQRPGHKLNSGEARGADGASLWERPQALGLIQAVGSYKWVVPGAQAQNPVADAVEAAMVDAVVHGTGAFQVNSDGSTERVDLQGTAPTADGKHQFDWKRDGAKVTIVSAQQVGLTADERRHYAELAAFPPKLQRDALYQDYAVPAKPAEEGGKPE